MKQFFKFMFASMLGFLLTFIIIIIIGITIIISLASLPEKDTVKVKEKTVLILNLNEEIYDRAPNNPFSYTDLTNFQFNKALGLKEVIDNIDKAASDNNIEGILLELSSVPSGLATVVEIRDALENFKESGKFIMSYAEVYTQKAYYLGSIADELYLNPKGYMDFKGISGKVMFMKGLLDKFDIKTTIIRGRNNKFKSAVEPFMYDKMSEANKEQTSKYVESLWNTMLEGISASRDISVDQLNIIADGLEVQSPEMAVELKLVDDILYKDELLDNLKNKLGLESGENIPTITLKKYNDVPKPRASGEKRNKNKVAVIYAQGEIQTKEKDDLTISSDKLAKTIRKARLDDRIKAIVLRVNSPGGSALASEVIWREVILAKEKKPVVVSMGNLAASGGYYISCGADKIYANPATLTGSIGVFGIMPNFQDALKNWLGITFDGVNTNKYSDFGSVVRPMTKYEEDVVRFYVEDIYETFISHVAEGRNMTKAEVDSIGQGRVWSGVDAKQLGLIDEFGGLEDAISEAAKMADIEDYRIYEMPIRKEFIEQLIQDLTDEMGTSSIEKELGNNYTYLKYMHKLAEMDRCQARMPFVIEVK